MDSFVARENVKRFKKQLQDCEDGAQKEVLAKLLADEEARLRGLGGHQD